MKAKKHIFWIAGILLIALICFLGIKAGNNKSLGDTKSCSLRITCQTVLKNMEKLDEEKKEIIPSDGVILHKENAEFLDGESAYDLLERELKNAKMHYDISLVPAYDSVYIKGIGNLYELDCGELSGWMYKINGETPSIGLNKYELQEGDKIEILYTCDMGKDIE